MSWRIVNGECVAEMNQMEPESFDLILTDPPYDLKKGTSKGGYMGKAWDGTGVAFKVETWKAAYKVLKPGGHLVAFGGTRTHHRLMCAIEDAGFEIRDVLMWLYGSGFPKSMNVGKAVQALQTGGSCSMSDQRKAVMGGKYVPSDAVGHTRNGSEPAMSCRRASPPPITEELTPLAKTFEGYGTALKPAYEPIIWAMKPLDGNFAKNAEKYGIAGINIAAGRIEANRKDTRHGGGDRFADGASGFDQQAKGYALPSGRWPSNLLLSCSCQGDKHEEGCSVRMLDEQSGNTGPSFIGKTCESDEMTSGYAGGLGGHRGPRGHKDSGGASRFFYCAKSSRSERERGLDGMESSEPCQVMGLGDSGGTRSAVRNRPTCNNHPTVKPKALMLYLLKLFDTPTGGRVLDPFVGSGSTLVACAELGRDAVGIDLSAEYCGIARRRVSYISPGTEEIDELSNHAVVSEDL